MRPLRQGYLAIKSGMVDTALVVGVEKFTDQVGAGVEEALATAADSDFESVQGMTATAQAALLMKRYMHEYDVPADGFAGFALTAHANGAGNPNAMFQKAIKPETVCQSRHGREPLNMFDAAPNADGAAALVLTRRDLLPSDWPHPLVKIAGSATASDTLALHDRKDMLFFEAATLSTGKAIKQAGITLDQIDLFEYHDIFSIYAALCARIDRICHPWPGLETGRRRTDRPDRTHPLRHHGRAQGTRLSRRRHGRVPGRRSGPAAAGAGRSEPGRRCKVRADPVAGRAGIHCRFPYPGKTKLRK